MKAKESILGSSQKTPEETQQDPNFNVDNECDRSAPSRATDLTQPANARINSHGFA